MITGGTAETVNPALANVFVDALRSFQLFDRLFDNSDDIKTLLPNLAVSAESNKDATVWVFHLRDGVTWHDGKPFSADDVVWAIRSWANFRLLANGFVAGLVDFKGVRKQGRLTVEVPLLSPVAQFPSIFTQYNLAITQDGSTAASLAHHPVGTGPFKFVSFIPGSQSVFVANRDYWQHPKPYVDKVIVNSTFTDETARLDALLSGALNVAPVTPPIIAKGQQSATQVTLLRCRAPIAQLVSMRVDEQPFADVRVRQALRLCVDRAALIETALDGFGTVGNDLQGMGCQYFASDLTRSRDIEQAKSLLKSAGREGLTFTLPTSNANPGQVEAATAFAQQAAAAGIRVILDNIPAAIYLTPASGYPTRLIGQDVDGSTAPSLTVVFRAWYTQPALFNETWWGKQPGGAAAEKVITEAIAASNPAKADELWREAQLQQFNFGGNIVWGNSDLLDLVANNVKGLKAGAAGNLNNFRLLDGWVE
jgi:peptide/nickel transport system substrate-binding protein